MVFCLQVCWVHAQYNQAVLRKNGKPVQRYQEGSFIRIETVLGLQYAGIINLIQNDTLYINHSGVAKKDIRAVLKKKQQHAVIPMEKDAFLWANAGIPIFALGLSASGENFGTSLLWGAGLVYGPLLLYNLKHLVFGSNRKFVLGEKYDLLILDLYRPEVVPIQNR